MTALRGGCSEEEEKKATYLHRYTCHGGDNQVKIVNCLCHHSLGEMTPRLDGFYSYIQVGCHLQDKSPKSRIPLHGKSPLSAITTSK